MRFDLKTPCLNCPFRHDATAIKFACEERAREIEEGAYRNGFPCHLSAVEEEFGDPEDPETGFVFGDRTQHCAGALILYLRHGDGPVPFVNLDEDEQDRIRNRLDFEAPVYDDEDSFLAAYQGVGR